MRQRNSASPMAPACLAVFLAAAAAAVAPSQDETALAQKWSEPRYSFLYGGASSRELLKNWTQIESSKDLDANRVETTRTYLDPRTELEVRCVSIVYGDFPAVEWTVFITNRGRTKSPILKDIQGLDIKLPSEAKVEAVLHWMRGDDNTGQSFAPKDKIFEPGRADAITLAPNNGKSSDGTAPFFNLDWGSGGMAAGIGWSGQWQAAVARDADGALTVRAGQQRTALALEPGETVRTPRILLVFWLGSDDLRGNNLFRQVLLRHVLPRRNGELVYPPVSASVNEVDPGGNYEGPHVRVMPALAERGYEVFWSDMDPQHWYPGGFPEGTGNWVPDPVKYPNGMKPVGEAAHKAGLGYLLWFEPERAHFGTKVQKEHPEWVMKPDKEWSQLFALHIPEARRWMTELMDAFLVETRLDWMRWDFNVGPLGFWRRNDAPDRQGMTENLHIQGLYAMWDELRARHPGLIIDNCAGGGRRIDIESLSRGLPLWHSDLQAEGSHPAADQLQNAGLFRWVPFHGTITLGYEPDYAFRSALTAGNINVGVDKDGLINNARAHTAAAAKRSTALTKRVRPYMIGDYYPLFPHLEREDVWFGHQFDRPDLGAGMVLVFRREKCAADSEAVNLRGVDPEARYDVAFEDGGKSKTMSGAELAGLRVTIPKAPGSALIFYTKRK